MKRQATLISLGLIAGIGLGYALGAHRATVGIPTPVPENTPPSTARSPSAIRQDGTSSGQPTDRQAPPSLEAAKRQLSDWLAAGSPDDDGEIFNCLEIWSASDPQAALAFIVSAPRFPRRRFALTIPLAAICQHDPQQVISWLHANLPEQERGRVAEVVIRRICQESPREALVLAEADQTPVDRDTFGQIFEQLTRVAPAEAVAAFNRLSDGGRETTAHAIAGSWAATDLPAALRWVESLSGKPGESGARAAVVAQLLSTNIDQALACLRQWSLPEQQTAFLLRMAAHENPDGLLNHLDAVPASQRETALGIILRQRFSSDPERMVALARAKLPADQAANLIGESWGRWLAEDRPAAEAWASTVQDNNLHSGIELAKLRDTADTDPNLFLSSIDNYPAALTSEKPLIQSALAQLNADDAAAWIARHPGIVDTQYIAATAAGYFEWNRDEALIWAHSLPPGNEQSQALAVIAQQWTNTGDSAQATATIAAITDQNLQTGTRFKVFATLYRKDRASARQWLAAQPVAPEIRANWETLAATTADSGTGPSIHID